MGIDAETLEVRAIEVTESCAGGGLLPPKLLELIPAEELISTVTADGAYDTRACRGAVAARSYSRDPDTPERSALEGDHTSRPGSQ